MIRYNLRKSPATWQIGDIVEFEGEKHKAKNGGGPLYWFTMKVAVLHGNGKYFDGECLAVSEARGATVGLRYDYLSADMYKWVSSKV